MVRFAALVLMTHHWQSTESFAGKCENLTTNDPDPVVRATAIGCFGCIYARSNNQRVEKLLARIVFDEAESRRIRERAYFSLLTVNGETFDHMPLAESVINFRMPEDVDWGFVRSFLI